MTDTALGAAGRGDFAVCRAYVEKLARSSGYEHDFDQAEERLRRALDRVPSIVVVGEVNRGKSSLVNALLGRPGLSPVGFRETTGAFIDFVPPDAELGEGEARLEFADGRTEPVPLSQVSDWVTIGGAALQHLDDSAVPIGASVGASGSTLPGAVIVDTPGTGGLNANHAALALGRAERAGVLVMVTDAGSPLTTPALEFLSACASSVEVIIVVLNRIDLNPGWRDRVTENRAALARYDAEHRTHFAQLPMVGVSALDALAALEIQDEALAQRAQAASNIDELAGLLRETVKSTDDLAYANAARQFLTIVASVKRVVEGVIRAQRGDDAYAAELVELAQQLQRVQERLETRGSDLGRVIGRLQLDFDRELKRQLRDFSARWQARIEKPAFRLTKTVEQELLQEMLGEVRRIEAHIRRGIEVALSEQVHGLYAQAGLDPLSARIELAGQVSPSAAPDRAPDPLAAAPLLGPAAMIVVGIVAVATGGLAGPLSAAAYLPIVAGAGGAVSGAAGMWGRNAAQAKQRLLAAIHDYDRRARDELSQAIGEALNQVRFDVAEDYRMKLRRRQQEVAEQRKEVDEARKASDAQRRSRIEAARRQLKDIDYVESQLHKYGNFAPARTVEPATT